jgi:hypothetical protein
MDATSSLGTGVVVLLLPGVVVLELSFFPLSEGQESRMQGSRAS